MYIFIPFQLDELKAGRYRLSLPFDPEYAIEADNKKKLLRHLFKDMQYYYADTKDEAFVRIMLQTGMRNSNSLLRIEYFSPREKFFLGLLFFGFSFAVYMAGLFVLHSFLVPSVPLSEKEAFQSHLYLLAYGGIGFYLIFWVLFHMLMAPFVLNLLKTMLEKGGAFKKFYTTFVLGPSHIFMSTPYSFKEKA